MNKTTKNMLLGAAMVGILSMGVSTAEAKSKAKKVSKGDAKVHCKGVNECKGQGNACKAGETCKPGANECKGQGVIAMDSEAACTEKGGTVVKM